MKRKTITLQFIQNGILLLNNNDIQEYKLKSVDNYKIINKDQFISETTQVLKDSKINNSLLTDNINIIVDNTYSIIEKDNITNIFTELSFNKITYLELTKLFNLKKQELLIDLSTNNIKIYYMNEVIDQKVYFNKYTQILSILLKNIIEIHSIKTIKLFGNKCNNKNIISLVEKYSNAEVYIYSHPNQVPIILLT